MMVDFELLRSYALVILINRSLLSNLSSISDILSSIDYMIFLKILNGTNSSEVDGMLAFYIDRDS